MSGVLWRHCASEQWDEVSAYIPKLSRRQLLEQLYFQGFNSTALHKAAILDIPIDTLMVIINAARKFNIDVPALFAKKTMFNQHVLHYAAHGASLEVVRMILIQNFNSLREKDTKGLTPTAYARRADRPDTVKMLDEVRNNVNENYRLPPARPEGEAISVNVPFV
jgi:hypothetical protein